MIPAWFAAARTRSAAQGARTSAKKRRPWTTSRTGQIVLGSLLARCSRVSKSNLKKLLIGWPTNADAVGIVQLQHRAFVDCKDVAGAVDRRAALHAAVRRIRDGCGSAGPRRVRTRERKFQREIRFADMLTSAIVWRWIRRLSLELTDEASSTASICAVRIEDRRAGTGQAEVVTAEMFLAMHRHRSGLRPGRCRCRWCLRGVRPTTRRATARHGGTRAAGSDR